MGELHGQKVLAPSLPVSSSHHSPQIFLHNLFSAPPTTKLSAALSDGPDKVILLSWLLEVSGLCSDEWDILYLAPPDPTPHVPVSSKTAGKLEAGGVGVSSVLCQFSPTLLHPAFAEMTSTPLGFIERLAPDTIFTADNRPGAVTQDHSVSRKDRKKILTGPQGAFWRVTVNFPERRLLTKTY